MPERKLIYADTVVEKLSELILLGDHEKEVLERYVEQCLAVDVVPVYCYECRFAIDEDAGEWRWCNHWNSCTEYNGHCHIGERKEYE